MRVVVEGVGAEVGQLRVQVGQLVNEYDFATLFGRLVLFTIQLGNNSYQ